MCNWSSNPAHPGRCGGQEVITCDPTITSGPTRSRGMDCAITRSHQPVGGLLVMSRLLAPTPQATQQAVALLREAPAGPLAPGRHEVHRTAGWSCTNHYQLTAIDDCSAEDLGPVQPGQRDPVHRRRAGPAAFGVHPIQTEQWSQVSSPGCAGTSRTKASSTSPSSPRSHGSTARSSDPIGAVRT